jgi:5-methylcytosine-specific restriction protein A
MARNLILDTAAATALDLAQRVENGTLNHSVAFARLTTTHGFAPHTANAHLNCYSHLLKGTPWKANLGVPAIRAMLESIAAKGAGDLLTALQSVQGNIDYSSTQGKKPRSLRVLLQEFQTRLADMVEIMPATYDLDNRVQAAISDGSANRLQRLARAPKKPKRTVRMVQDFDRNPDVVAEVLLRAKGHCEGCGSSAPFNRRSNGTAYLEVHHVIRLADQGDDSVENAIALCPNCHRQRHFG